MGSLLNQQIDQTYQGMIKTSDESSINATEKRLQDGTGNDLPVEVGTGGMTYYGTQDFTNATVTGIGGGGGVGTTFRFKANGVYDGGAQGPYTFFNNTCVYYPIYLEQGGVLDAVQFQVTAPFSTASIQLGIYDVQKYTGNQSAFGYIAPKDLIDDFGSVSGTTGGFKQINGINFTPPYSGVYFIAMCIPGTWDGAIGGFSSLYNYGNSNARSFQYADVAVAATTSPLMQLRSTGTSLPTSLAANFSYSTTSARNFMLLKTN